MEVVSPPAPAHRRRSRMAARGNETDRIYIYSAHKYFAKISVLCVLKKYAVSAMMETQKEKPL